MPFSEPSPVVPASPSGLDPALAAHAARLRAVAARTADAAAHLATITDDLPSFDRADVWRGARATAFRKGLADQRRRLVDPNGGVVVDLEQTVRRLVARAEQLEADAVATPGAGFGPGGAALVPHGPAATATPPMPNPAPTPATAPAPAPGWMAGPLLGPG